MMFIYYNISIADKYTHTVVFVSEAKKHTHTHEHIQKKNT